MRASGPRTTSPVAPFERDGLALADDRPPHAEEAPLLVHHHLARPHDAGLAPAARHHRRVRGEAAAGGEDALGGMHARHVLRRRLGAHQDDLLLLQRLLDRQIRVEHHGPDRGGGGGGQALGERGVAAAGIHRLHEELLQRGRVDATQRGGSVEQPLAHHLHRDPHRGAGGALARARLQDVEPPSCTVNSMSCMSR